MTNRAARFGLGVLVAAALIPVGIVHWRAVFAPDSAEDKVVAPQPAEEHRTRGEAALREGRVVEALMAYRHARDLAPTDPAGVVGFMKARLTMAATDRARIAPDTADELCYEADYLMDKVPDGKAIWLAAKGNALAESGRVRAARAALEAAVKADAKSPEARTGLGLVLLQLGGQLAAGRAELEAAVALKRDHVPALIPLAQLLVAAGDKTRGRELLQRAIDATEDARAKRIVEGMTTAAQERR